MKVVFMYVDRRPVAKKVKSYAKAAVKFTALTALLVLNTEMATEAFKLGNIVDVVRAIPSGIR